MRETVPDKQSSVLGLWRALRGTLTRVQQVLPLIARRHKVRLLLATGLMLVSLTARSTRVRRSSALCFNTASTSPHSPVRTKR